MSADPLRALIARWRQQAQDPRRSETARMALIRCAHELEVSLALHPPAESEVGSTTESQRGQGEWARRSQGGQP